MKTLSIVLAWVLAAGVVRVATACEDQPPPRDLPPKIAKSDAVPNDRSLRFFLGLAPYAKTVGIATVSEARVEAIEDQLKTVPGQTPWREVVTVEWQATLMLYGTKDKADGNTVTFAAIPPRAPQKPNPALQKGDKLIVLQIRQPEHKWTFDGAVAWSEEAEAATRDALAPGWTRSGGRAFLCPWCAGRKGILAEQGVCGTCGAATHSASYKLCPACAGVSGTCQLCGGGLGPATPGVTLQLGTIDPKSGHKDPLLMNIAPDSFPSLYVSAQTRDNPAQELHCFNNNLRTCSKLYFVVDGTGIQGRVPVFFEQEKRVANADEHLMEVVWPDPLKGSACSELKLRSAANPFATRGTYTVRAVAGRLVSNPVTIVVKDLGAGGEPVVGGPPAGISVDADGKSISRMQDGKMVWKMQVGFPIGQVGENDGKLVITSADGGTQMVVDAASGKTLEMRRLR